MRKLNLLLAATLAAQTVDRTKEPPTPPLRDFTLPPTQDGTLPNGLKVVLVEDTRYPMVELRMGFHAGKIYDPGPLPGLSEITASLLKEGTAARNARQLAEEITAIGGSLDASSSYDYMTVGGYAPSAHLDRLIELAGDMVVHASFPEEEIRLRKQNRLQELADERSQPEILASERLRLGLFGSHPYARMLPTKASIEAIDREKIAAFRTRYLRPNNAVLVLVGPFTETKPVWRILETRLGKWERGETAQVAAFRPAAAKLSVTLVDRPGSVQADVAMGTVSIPRRNKDHFPLMVASTILGGGTASRFFNDIREKQGFAYSVYSQSVPYKETGLHRGTMQVRNEVVEQAVKSMLGHFGRMTSERVSAQELSDIKNHLSGDFVLALAKPSGVADQLLATRLDGLTNAYLETYVQQVRQVEPDQILAVARKYFDPASMTVVVVGDAKAIQAPLEKTGPVKVER